MSQDDKDDTARNKARNKADELKGKVKEGIGKATDDEDLRARGKAQQSKGSLKQAAEKLKDAWRKAK